MWPRCAYYILTGHGMKTDPSYSSFCGALLVLKKNQTDPTIYTKYVLLKIKIRWDMFMLNESLDQNLEAWRNQQEFVDLKWNSVWLCLRTVVTVPFSSWANTLRRLRKSLATTSNSCNHNYSNFLSALGTYYYLFRNSYTITGVSKIPVLRRNSRPTI